MFSPNVKRDCVRVNMADVAETLAASPLNEMYAESLRSSEQDAAFAGGGGVGEGGGSPPLV